MNPSYDVSERFVPEYVQTGNSSNCFSTKRYNRYAQFYTFTLNESLNVAIDLVSSTDPFVFLLKGKGKEDPVIARNNNHININSHLELQLTPGDYTIEATTRVKSPFPQVEAVSVLP